MSLDNHIAYPAPTKPTAGGIVGFVSDWSERIVTVFAVSFGVLAVALIAVVMGMA